ncbi:hypothetical protein [Haloarcula amylovorans]|uniref:hypothetical protein n=1 Tax=Haloarcula amylovorans TaxID=2562280 RepID=UPI00143140E6|nr:hypothetical protein [Halomicroarcula amylolytica]
MIRQSREEIVPPEGNTVERGTRLLKRYLEDDPTAVEIVEEAGKAFWDAMKKR